MQCDLYTMPDHTEPVWCKCNSLRNQRENVGGASQVLQVFNLRQLRNSYYLIIVGKIVEKSRGFSLAFSDFEKANDRVKLHMGSRH